MSSRFSLSVFKYLPLLVTLSSFQYPSAGWSSCQDHSPKADRHRNRRNDFTRASREDIPRAEQTAGSIRSPSMYCAAPSLGYGGIGWRDTLHHQLSPQHTSTTPWPCSTTTQSSRKIKYRITRNIKCILKQSRQTFYTTPRLHPHKNQFPSLVVSNYCP